MIIFGIFLVSWSIFCYLVGYRTNERHIDDVLRGKIRHLDTVCRSRRLVIKKLLNDIADLKADLSRARIDLKIWKPGRDDEGKFTKNV